MQPLIIARSYTWKVCYWFVLAKSTYGWKHRKFAATLYLLSFLAFFLVLLKLGFLDIPWDFTEPMNFGLPARFRFGFDRAITLSKS